MELLTRHIPRCWTAIVLGTALSSGCHPQPADAEPQEAELEAEADTTADRLATAFADWLTVSTRASGEPVYAPHCRYFRPGCEERIRALADLITEEAYAYDLDPFLIGAVAVKESGLDPTAVGPRGSIGILQLNPRGVGAGLRFTRQPDYRRQCARLRVTACQEPIIERGTEHLAGWLEQCDDLVPALAGYNSGECRQPSGYARRVLRIRDDLIARADVSSE
ncbi:MAG: transglycosylase SLT domain-containing protein [Myxococcota bacterium]